MYRSIIASVASSDIVGWIRMSILIVHEKIRFRCCAFYRSQFVPGANTAYCDCALDCVSQSAVGLTGLLVKIEIVQTKRDQGLKGGDACKEHCACDKRYTHYDIL